VAVGHYATHELVMTTRGKRRLTMPYPAVVEVEAGHCTLDVVDPMQVVVVAPDKPEEGRVSVTPLEPNEDYVPAQVHVVVNAPVTVVEIGPSLW
jgi:hypothetical protein